ncbi:hypothetical protein C8J56DRAFT_899265 [Mycena floridula]|nr:hypothetical protein C8J56DRAFT_899265 [Mycena floridula]
MVNVTGANGTSHGKSLVTSKLATDIHQTQGPGTVQARIAFEDGVLVPRDMTRKIQKELAPEGAARRAPGKAARKPRGTLKAITSYETTRAATENPNGKERPAYRT